MKDKRRSREKKEKVSWEGKGVAKHVLACAEEQWFSLAELTRALRLEWKESAGWNVSVCQRRRKDPEFDSPISPNGSNCRKEAKKKPAGGKEETESIERKRGNNKF